MAGSDQSVNLSGMLSGIGNTLGSMGAVGGIYADSFANALKPQIDPSSPESYQAAAEWASNNGRLDEAAAYRKEANALGLANTKLEKEKSEAEVISKLGEAEQLFNEANLKGNPAGAKQALEKANSLLDPSIPMSSSLRMQIRNAVDDMNKQGTKAADSSANMRSATAASQQMVKLQQPEYVDQLPGGQESADLISDRITKELMSAPPEVLEAYNNQMTAVAKMEKDAKIADDNVAEEALNAELMTAYHNKATEADLADIIGKSGIPGSVGDRWLKLAKTRDDANKAGTPSQKLEIIRDGIELAFEDSAKIPELQGGDALKALENQWDQFKKRMKPGSGVQSNTELASQMSKLQTRILDLNKTVREEQRKAERDYEHGIQATARDIAINIPSKGEMQVVVQQVRKRTDSWFNTIEIDGLMAVQLTRDWKLHELDVPTIMFQYDDQGQVVLNDNGEPKIVKGQEERFKSYVNQPRDFTGEGANTRRRQQGGTSGTSGTSAVEKTVKQVAEVVEGEKIPQPLYIPSSWFEEGEWDSKTAAEQQEFIDMYNETQRGN